MFTTQNLPLLMKSVALKQNEDGERFAHCKLLLEPFFHELAREMADEVADHLFMEQPSAKPPHDEMEWVPRREVSEMAFNLLYPRQRIVAREHPDLPMRVELHDVGIEHIRVTRPDEAKARLRLEFVIVVPLVEDRAIEFVVRTFGRHMYFTFDVQQPTLLDSAKAAIKRMNDVAARSGITTTLTVPDGNGGTTSVTFGRESPDAPESSRRRGSAGNFEELNAEVTGTPPPAPADDIRF